jgi:hypothetical protein
VTSQPSPAPEGDAPAVIPVRGTHERRIGRLPWTLVLPDEAGELFQAGTPAAGKSHASSGPYIRALISAPAPRHPLRENKRKEEKKMQMNEAIRREAMETSVRWALAREFTEWAPAQRPDESWWGFEVAATSGTSAIVTFRGKLPPGEPDISEHLALYAQALRTAGFWAEHKPVQGYVAVEVQQ